MEETSTSARQAVAEAAKRHLTTDFSRVVVWSQGAHVIYASCKVLPSELELLEASFGDRDAVVQQGLRLEGRRYEVHRHHPPLVYGRNMVDSEPEVSTGLAIYRMDGCSRAGSGGGAPCYLAATYEQPHTSAQAVPRLVDFARRHLEGA